MRHTSVIALLAGGAVLASAAALAAQRWGTGPFPRDGACFFRDADYRGEYFCVRAGDSYGSVPGDMNDRISSIALFGNAQVIVFKDRNYDGSSTRFDYAVRDLKEEGWNDRVSSIRVGSRSGGGFPVGRPPMQNPDAIVRRAYQDILERNPDAAGMRLYRSRIIDEGWTEQQVREALRKSPEYRRLTIDKAREIVRRAYLAVLKREPDSGSQGYVNRVVRDGLSQSDIERELRNSAEYRNRNR